MNTKAKTLIVLALIAPSLCGAKKYVVGVEKLDYMPYYGMLGNEYSGFAAEMFKAFEKQSGVELEVTPFPVTRLFDQLKKKKVDAKFPDNSAWGAAAKQSLTDLIYSEPVVEFTDAFVTTPDKNIIKTVSMVRGFTPPYPDAYKFQEVNSIKAAASMFINNRVDAVYGNLDVIKYSYKHEGGANELILLEGKPAYKAHYHMSMFSPELKEKFDAFLKTEEYQALLEKFELRR